MANYARRATNDVSQFLREGNLNAVHTAEPMEDYTLGDDLDVFTHTEFHDFDTGLPANFKADSPPAPKSGEPSATTLEYSVDYLNAGTFCSTTWTVVDCC